MAKSTEDAVRREVFTLILGAALSLLASLSQAATISGTMTIDNAHTGGAIVYLENTQHPVYRTQEVHAVIDQKDLVFVPQVLPVVRGTVVEFTNSDDVLHN